MLKNGALSLSKAIWLNCAVVAGIVVGLFSAPQSLSGRVTGRVAVFFFAFCNLLLLVAQPRLTRRPAELRSNLYTEAWGAIAEKPLVSALTLMQLWAVARCLGSVITLGRAYSSPLVGSQHLQGRLLLGIAALVVVGLIWLVSAAGIWGTRRWAWWLALILNAVSAGTTILIQFFTSDQFLIDPVAVLMVVALLLPTTRRLFNAPAPTIGRPNS